MIAMSSQIMLVDEKIVVPVEFPKLAIDDVEVFIAEVLGHLVDVLLFLKKGNDGKKIATPQFLETYSTAP